MLQVLFIVRAKKVASTRVRVLNLLPFLTKAGIAATVEEFPRSFRDRLRLYRRCRAYDVVVLQRLLLSPAHFALLRWHARRLAYDFDDAIFLRNDNEGTPKRSGTRSRRFARTVRRSDGVIAGNAYLAQEASRFQKKVEVLASAVPYRGVPVRQEFGGDATPVVGWVGSRHTVHYLTSIGALLGRVRKQVGFRLHIISDIEVAIPGVDCVNIAWRAETQESEICRFDVGIMPLADNAWTRGKCAYKLLQYMASGIPFVASAVGMNEDVSDGNQAGFTARDDDEFARRLVQLLSDPSLRGQMGGHARKLAADYSLETIGERLAEYLKALKAD